MIKKFESAYLNYLDQIKNLNEAQKHIPPIEKPFDINFLDLHNNNAIKYVKEIINPLENSIQSTIEEINALLLNIYPSNHNEVSQWIKSEIRTFCRIQKKSNNEFSDTFSSIYNFTPTKFDFIDGWLNKNNIRNIDFLKELYMLVCYIEIENMIEHTLWTISSLLNYVSCFDETSILIQKILYLYDNKQLEDNTIILNLLGVSTQLPLNIKERLYNWIRQSIKNEYILSQIR